MSYFDPDVYNYEALKPEHQQLIDPQVYGALQGIIFLRDR